MASYGCIDELAVEAIYHVSIAAVRLGGAGPPVNGEQIPWITIARTR
jgi:hypothetical protein